MGEDLIRSETVAGNTGGRVFDRQLQMFVEPPREADPAHLRFLRWLGEHGRLEHETAGPAVGEYAAAPTGVAADELGSGSSLPGPNQRRG